MKGCKLYNSDVTVDAVVILFAGRLGLQRRRYELLVISIIRYELLVIISNVEVTVYYAVTGLVSTTP